jgi:hypothetical protein
MNSQIIHSSAIKSLNASQIVLFSAVHPSRRVESTLQQYIPQKESNPLLSNIFLHMSKIIHSSAIYSSNIPAPTLQQNTNQILINNPILSNAFLKTRHAVQSSAIYCSYPIQQPYFRRDRNSY